VRAPQLPLPFDEGEPYAEQDFIAAPCNALARSWLERPAEWTNGRMVLWGEPGCGRSFLLHLWARSHAATLIAGPQLSGLSAPPSRPVAVDDADGVPQEIALLHLLNAAAEAGQPVLLTAKAPPAIQAPSLPDLASRLRASLIVQIAPPDDIMLNALLRRFAAQRQLALTDQLARYLLARLPRTADAFRIALERLDRAQLARGGRITRALADEVLADLVYG
jgi:chromosomal replication initiation ATPase DnaA